MNRPNGYILTGGKSSRMGTDKATMMLEGKPMLQFVIDAMKNSVDEIFLVTGNPQHESFGLKTIPDEIPELGPAGGILSALSHSSAKRNFIFACDMPLIRPAFFSKLISHTGDEEILMPSVNGLMQPLAGLYRTSCLQKWQQLIMSGEKKLQTIVSQFDLAVIEMEGDELKNINTPDEFASLKNHLP